MVKFELRCLTCDQSLEFDESKIEEEKVEENSSSNN